MHNEVVERDGYLWFENYDLPLDSTPQQVASALCSMSEADREKLERVRRQLPCPREYMQAHMDEYGWDEAILTKARLFQSPTLPEPVQYFPEFGRCWQNSFAYAERTGAHYVEGLVVTPMGIWLHSWNSPDGVAVEDYTWPCQEWNKYFGIALDLVWLREHGYREGGILLHHQALHKQGKGFLKA